MTIIRCPRQITQLQHHVTKVNQSAVIITTRRLIGLARCDATTYRINRQFSDVLNWSLWVWDILGLYILLIIRYKTAYENIICRYVCREQYAWMAKTRDLQYRFEINIINRR